MSGPNLNQISRQNFYPVKAYEAPNFAKTYSSKASGEADPALAGWLEEAQAYYRGVMSGELERPEPYKWQEFLSQMQWAKSMAFSGGEDATWGDAYGPEGEQVPQEGPYGSTPGTNGPNSWIYDTVQTNTGFTGDGSRNDIFGTANTQNFEQPSAQMSFEITQDHGVSVMKQIVTTSQGTAVYYHDNYTSPDFTLNVNIADPTKVTGLDSLPVDVKAKIKVEKFDPNKKPEEIVTQSSLTGQPVEGEDNAFYYEAETADQTIDFRFKGGENETHYAAGNVNVSFPITSKSDVTEGPFAVNGDTYDFKVVVTHHDGSTDTVYTKKPFTVNINTVEGYTTFAGAVPEDGKVPEEYKEIFTLNGKSAESAAPEVEVQGDAPTTEDDDQRTFDGGSFDIYSRKDGKTTNIYARTDLTLHASSNREYWKFGWDFETQRYFVEVYTDESRTELKETIYIDNMVDNIKLDIDPTRVEFLGDLREEFDPHKLNTAVQMAEKISFLNEEENGPTEPEANTNWPEAGRVSQFILDSNHGAEAKTIAEAVDQAIQTGDWAQVRFLLSQGSSETINDIVRKFLSGLKFAVDGNETRFQAALDQIPSDIRTGMRDRANESWLERDEKYEGDLWNTDGAENILSQSISNG